MEQGTATHGTERRMPGRIAAKEHAGGGRTRSSNAAAVAAAMFWYTYLHRNSCTSML